MSQATKHTPGPWTVETVHNEQGWNLQIQGNRTGASAVLVAEMPIRFTSIPETQHATWDHQAANACLIAAAPDLLAAAQLETALEDADAPAEDTRWKVVWNMRRNALTKAEGDTP